MQEEQMISLAEQIAAELSEVTRNEWMHWVQIVQIYGPEKAIRWSERLSRDVTLRPAVKRAHQLIAKTMRNHLTKVKCLSLAEQNILVGYVAQLLAVETLRGSLATSNQQSKPNVQRRR